MSTKIYRYKIHLDLFNWIRIHLTYSAQLSSSTPKSGPHNFSRTIYSNVTKVFQFDAIRLVQIDFEV